MEANALDRLKRHLAMLKPGRIDEPGTTAGLLWDCWGRFAGGDEAAMADDKVLRMEDAEWNPPKLSFTVERHGGTVQGSSRGELQRWVMNLETMTATSGKSGHRQLSPMSPRLSVEPIAEDLVRSVMAGRIDSRLKWLTLRRRVQILIGKIIPEGSGARATVIGRRRRLVDTLRERFRVAGWTEVPDTAPHTYQREADDEGGGRPRLPPH